MPEAGSLRVFLFGLPKSVCIGVLLAGLLTAGVFRLMAEPLGVGCVGVLPTAVLGTCGTSRTSTVPLRAGCLGITTAVLAGEDCVVLLTGVIGTGCTEVLLARWLADCFVRVSLAGQLIVVCADEPKTLAEVD